MVMKSGQTSAINIRSQVTCRSDLDAVAHARTLKWYATPGDACAHACASPCFSCAKRQPFEERRSAWTTHG